MTLLVFVIQAPVSNSYPSNGEESGLAAAAGSSKMVSANHLKVSGLKILAYIPPNWNLPWEPEGASFADETCQWLQTRVAEASEIWQ